MRRRDDAPETTGTLETLNSGCAFAYTLVYTQCGCGSDGTSCPRRSPRDFHVVLRVVQGVSQQRLSLQVRRVIGTYSAFGLGKGPFVAPWRHHNASTYKWGTPGHIEVLSGGHCTTRSTTYYEVVDVLAPPPIQNTN